MRTLAGGRFSVIGSAWDGVIALEHTGPDGFPAGFYTFETKHAEALANAILREARLRRYWHEEEVTA